MSRFYTCKEISPTCPIEATTYGYYPSLAFNSLFVAIFGNFIINWNRSVTDISPAVTGACQLVFGIRFKTYTWLLGLIIGTWLEAAGYVGRILLHKNPWNEDGQKLQIVALVLAPSFIAAAIDLSLKHLVLIFGRKWSRFPPRSYPWIFISADFFAIVVQAIGGSLAASGAAHPNLLTAGDDGIVAGIALQVFQLVVFGAVALEYAYRVYSHKNELSPEALSYAHSGKFRFFMTAIVLSYITILTRCWYRLPEMWNG